MARHEKSHELQTGSQPTIASAIVVDDSSLQSEQGTELDRPLLDFSGLDVLNTEFVWDAGLLSQDLLPPLSFDSDFSLPPILAHKPSPRPKCIATFSDFTSNLPALDLIEDDHAEAENDSGNDQSTIEKQPMSSPWALSESTYEHIFSEVSNYALLFPVGCTLPSSNALSRNLESYFGQVHEQLPFIHSTTFSVEQRPIELILAVAAVGSMYRYESPKCHELYFMSKAILTEKMRCEDIQSAQYILKLQPGINTDVDRGTQLRRTQTMILLAYFSSFADVTLRSDAMAMSGQLSPLARSMAMSTSENSLNASEDWQTWTEHEEQRRTCYAAYAVSSLQCIAFDTAPHILSHELHLPLPSSTKRWEEKNMAHWQTEKTEAEVLFSVALKALFHNDDAANQSTASSFACYLLVLGLLQQIYLEQNSIHGILPERREIIEVALRNWQSLWTRLKVPNLDRLSSKDTLSLNSASLLRLAYARLALNIGPSRGLAIGDTALLTRAISHFKLERSSHLDKAILQALHALSIPVRLGIEMVARTRLPIWSIEHSLCGLECAVLIWLWLRMISDVVGTSGLLSLRRSEQRLLRMIEGVVLETDEEIGNAHYMKLEDSILATRYRLMAGTILKLWVTMFQGNNVFELDNLIGQTLQHLASYQAQGG